MKPRSITLKRPTPRSSLGFARGEVLDDAGGDPGDALPGARFHVVFAGIPLELWKRLAATEAVEALDPAGISFRIGAWHVEGVTRSATGGDLHVVYATLICLGPTS